MCCCNEEVQSWNQSMNIIILSHHKNSNFVSWASLAINSTTIKRTSCIAFHLTPFQFIWLLMKVGYSVHGSGSSFRVDLDPALGWFLTQALQPPHHHALDPTTQPRPSMHGQAPCLLPSNSPPLLSEMQLTASNLQNKRAIVCFSHAYISQQPYTNSGTRT